MRNSIKVSALIPTYNRRAYASRALDSILAQTVPVDEIVVVDDGSTDGSTESIRASYGNKVRVIRQENTGVSGARLRAVQEARGEWIAFLDSDDEWTPNRNCLFKQALEELPEDVAWLFGNVRLVRGKGDEETLFEKYGLKLNGDLQVFEDSMSIQHPFQFGLLQASLIRRHALIEVGAFSAGLRHSEDFLAGMQVACRYKFAAIRDEVTKMYRTSDLWNTSLDLTGRGGADAYRARMIAFSLAADSGRKGCWGAFYAEAVRGLCKVRAESGETIRLLSLEQFRYGISGTAIAFSCAAFLGRPGIRLWKQAGRLSRRLLGRTEFDPFPLE